MSELAIRTAVILAIAWVAVRLLGRASAATRHRVWHGAVLAVLLAPLAAPVAPTYGVPSAAEIAGFARRTTAALVRSRVDVSTSLAQTVDVPSRTGQASAPVVRSFVDISASAGLLARAVARPAALVWITGSVLVSLWFLAGWVRAVRATRRAHSAPATWQDDAERLRRHLGIGRPVTVKVLPHNTSPLVTGLWQSTILVPPSARAWSAERRQAVLLHELAHIRRGDCRVQALTQLAGAVYWFNPLVWVAASALRTERERACDAEVLRQGTRPSSYAEHLLEIARDLTPAAMRPTAALAMARPTELEGRLLAVLADRRPRVANSASGWLVALLITGATGIALGATPGGAAARAPRPAPIAGSLSPTAFDGHSPESRERDRHDRAVAAAALESAADPSVRQRAALNLAATGAPDTIPALTRALRDDSQDVREKAALALGLQSSPAVVPPLVAALGDASAQVREKAALGLALRRDPRSVDALIAAAADPDAQVREKVAMALGTSGDPRAAGPLQALLTDRDPQVREKASVALALVGSLETNDAAGERARAGLRTLVGGLLALIQ